MITAPPKLLYTRKQAAEMLGIGTTLLDQERRAGRIIAIKVGRAGIRFRHDELEAWANAQQETE